MIGVNERNRAPDMPARHGAGEPNRGLFEFRQKTFFLKQLDVIGRQRHEADAKHH